MSHIDYQITSGKVWIDKVLQPERGYSGHGEGLNNPDEQSLHGVGPIPEGTWRINPWEAFHPHLGPIVSHLTPISVPNEYGRSGFFIHGDNAAANHSASDGCIIMDHNLRVRVRDSHAQSITVFR